MDGPADAGAASRRRGSQPTPGQPITGVCTPAAAVHINGGGALTRADAEREYLSAIAFALGGDRRDYDREAEAINLAVNVAPAA